MKLELKKYGLGFGFTSVLAVTLSSCSLVGKGKYASQWEIQTDVPASLSSGQASTPSAETTATGNHVKTNLDGLSPIPDLALDLPASENGGVIDIPKPGGSLGAMAYQSPPEMLNIPGADSAGDLPYRTGSPQGSSDTLLAPPPPPVTEEELALAPGALVAEPAPPATEIPPAPAPPADGTPASAVPATAPSIPLLYGKLDLAPFLNPTPPLAATEVPAPAAP